MYAEYKANRPSMPDEWLQIEPLHQSVIALGFPLLCVEGVEADDVIGTLARSSAAADRPVIISTGDKDMAQLVDGHITLVNTMSGSSMDVEGVKEKFGVAPEQIIDYLALMGDSSDNIPGVPGIGPKTASGLLVGVNGGLTELYAQLDIVPTLPIRGAKTLPAKLEEHKEMAFLSYQLATIKIDVPLDVELDDLQMRAEDPAKLYELYTLLEFKSWINDLDRDAKRLELSSAAAPEPAGDLFSAPEAEAPAAPAEAAYETILDQARFDAWLEKLKNAKLFAFDTETTGIDAQQAQLVGLSFAVQANEAAYIPLTHSYIGVPEQLDRDTVCARSSRFSKPEPTQVGQHANVDRTFCNCAIGGIRTTASPWRRRLDRCLILVLNSPHPPRMDSSREYGPHHGEFPGHRRQGRQATDLRSNCAGAGGAVCSRRRRHHVASAPDPVRKTQRHSKPGQRADRHRDSIGTGAGAH